MGVFRGNIFAVDWTDLEAVKRVCKTFGHGSVVIKFPERDNYNITHTDNMTNHPDLYRGAKVVFRPSPYGTPRKRYGG
jgi:hypothetical protein